MAAKHHHDAKQAEEAAVPAAQPPVEPAQAVPADSGGLTPDTIEQLKHLGELRPTGPSGRGIGA